MTENKGLENTEKGRVSKQRSYDRVSGKSIKGKELSARGATTSGQSEESKSKSPIDTKQWTGIGCQ
jgi:hypothetical protein